MNEHAIRTLMERLADRRSRRVVFLSHCVLNENVRYLGGACSPGCVEAIVDGLRHEGIGMCQMRCPEQQAWGGVLKRRLLTVYGSRGTLAYRWRRLLVPLFLAYTAWRYRRLAREVVHEVEDYLRSGFEVAAIVGIDGSPSCGVHTTLDVWRSLDALARCPLATLDRRFVNDVVIAGSVVPGEGLFVQALRERLRRRGLAVRFQAHSLVAELAGRSPTLVGAARPAPPEQP